MSFGIYFSNKYKFSLICILISLMALLPALSQEDQLTHNIRDFVNLMDYIGGDYHNAVQNGNIADKNEYAEMQEFITRAGELYSGTINSLPDSTRQVVGDNLNQLRNAISSKQDSKLILDYTNKVKLSILKLNIIEMVPSSMPDLKNGKFVFENHCAGCHGMAGDGEGPQGKSLDPRPANFLDASLMRHISNFQVYNTIKLGIKGTGMSPVKGLSEKETWDAAFYVNSLRFKQQFGTSGDTLSKLYKSYSELISLSELSTLSDDQLAEKYPDKAQNPMFFAALRMHHDNRKTKTLDVALSYLKQLSDSYSSKDFSKSEDIALKAYLEGIEPYEQELQAINAGLKTDIESAMYQLRSDIRLRKDLNIIQKDISAASTLIIQASSELNDREATFWFAFLMAASIILREGLEAILIIITILGVLKSINAPKAKRWVHFGWVSALLVGFLSMFYIDLVVRIGVRNREMVEGVGSFIAVALLIYIGFWLHSKTEAKKWKEFVENKIMKMVNGKNMMGLAVISFVVVFREAFESAIFLSAVNFESQSGSSAGMYTGALTSLAVVLLFAWLAVKYSVKLPIRKLFKYSAIMIAILSIVLMGKGIRALQESGYINVTQLPVNFNLSLLGIYPTMETFIAQMLLLAITIFIWNYAGKRARAVQKI